MTVFGFNWRAHLNAHHPRKPYPSYDDSGQRHCHNQLVPSLAFTSPRVWGQLESLMHGANAMWAAEVTGADQGTSQGVFRAYGMSPVGHDEAVLPYDGSYGELRPVVLEKCNNSANTGRLFNFRVWYRDARALELFLDAYYDWLEQEVHIPMEQPIHLALSTKAGFSQGTRPMTVQEARSETMIVTIPAAGVSKFVGQHGSNVKDLVGRLPTVAHIQAMWLGDPSGAHVLDCRPVDGCKVVSVQDMDQIQAAVNAIVDQIG